ncbi:MAG: TonB-dependent receptor [Ichthyobacteriaceae bacterium]|nr:TonB-dependent receptor [Ichthyobacteriaceae bacterium]
MKNLIILLLVLLSVSAFSQNHLFTGVVKGNNGVLLDGASVYFTKSKVGTITNNNGEFSVSINLANDVFVVSYVGYTTFTSVIKSNTLFNVNLKRLDNVLEEAVVTDQYNKVKSIRLGEVFLTSKEVSEIAVSFGEKDIIKTLQLIPGVQQGKEGQSGMFVRGGNNSMNQYLIDNIYLHNTSHIGGFLSAINSDIVSNLRFSKSGISSEYGGKLSSVTAIESNAFSEENDISGSVGILSSSISCKTSLKSINTNIQVSARRTYLDLLQPLLSGVAKNTILDSKITTYFYDVFFKSETSINKNNSVDITYYKTKDYFYDNTQFPRKINWGNNIFGINWKHKFENNLVSKFYVSRTNYFFSFNGETFPYTYIVDSDVLINSFKNKNVLLKENHKLLFGLEYNYVRNLPKVIDVYIVDEKLNIKNDGLLKSHDVAVYFEDEFSVSEWLNLAVGLRYSAFAHVGSFTDKIADKTYNDGDLVKFYNALEPRLSANYLINNYNSLKFSYQKNTQYFHQATLSSLSLPIDFYYSSSNYTKPQQLNQVSIGYNYYKNNIDFSVESYYSKISDLSDFKNGSINNLMSDNIYNDMIYGEAHSAGLELMMNYSVKKINTKVVYTLSKSVSKFNAINNGEWFSSTFDRPHNLNVSVSYKFNNKLNVSAFFTYSSGQNHTPPKDIRIINEFPVINYVDKNSKRYPSYHRADIAITYVFDSKLFEESKLNFTIYNLYNRHNVFDLIYNIEVGRGNDIFKLEPYGNSLFPIFPSISWTFKI